MQSHFPVFTQLIGSDWIWGLLVPKVSHWLALIPGIGKGWKVHAAEKRVINEVVSEDPREALL